MIRRVTVALAVVLGLGCLGLICDGGCPACPAGQHITRDCRMGSGDGVIMDCVCGCAPSETPGAGGSP